MTAAAPAALIAAQCITNKFKELENRISSLEQELLGLKEERRRIVK